MSWHKREVSNYHHYLAIGSFFWGEPRLLVNSLTSYRICFQKPPWTFWFQLGSLEFASWIWQISVNKDRIMCSVHPKEAHLLVSVQPYNCNSHYLCTQFCPRSVFIYHKRNIRLTWKMLGQHCSSLLQGFHPTHVPKIYSQLSLR